MENIPSTLKICALPDNSEDVTNVLHTENKTFYVLEAKFIRLLVDALKSSFEIIHPKKFEIGQLSKSSGHWTGMLGMLQDDECDIIVDLIAITKERTEAFDFSIPYYITDATFVTNKPEPLQKILTIIYVFSLNLWVAVGVAFIFMSLVFYIFNYRRLSYQKSLLEIYNVLLEQPFNFKIIRKLMSQRFLIFSWISGCMILTFSYKALLLSFFTFPPINGIHDIDELYEAVLQKSYICSTYSGSYLIGTLSDSEDNRLKIIGKSLQENSFNTLNVDGVLNQKDKVKYAFVTARPILLPLKQKYFLSQDSFFTMMFAIPMRKKFCCKSALNEIIRRISAAGLYDQMWHEKEMFASLKFIHDSNDKEVEQVLSFEECYGTFLILASGLLISLLTLSIEMFFPRASVRFNCFTKMKGRMCMKGFRFRSKYYLTNN